MDNRLENWCDEVIGEVRCWMDHNRIRAELEEHIEDRCMALEELNYPPELAAERTLTAMGDPVTVGRALDREHPLWLGWCWIASVVAVFLMCIVVLVEVQISAGTLDRFWERIVETVSPTPYEELAVALDETFDYKSEYDMDYTCIGVGSAAAVDAGNWKVEVPKAVWWDRFGKFTHVSMVLKITPERPWYGSNFESVDELLVTDSNGDKAINLMAKRNMHIGVSGFPWFSVQDEVHALGHGLYVLGVTIKGDADWVEITWPYGKQPWSLRVEKETAS